MSCVLVGLFEVATNFHSEAGWHVRDDLLHLRGFHDTDYEIVAQHVGLYL